MKAKCKPSCFNFFLVNHWERDLAAVATLRSSVSLRASLSANFINLLFTDVNFMQSVVAKCMANIYPVFVNCKKSKASA